MYEIDSDGSVSGQWSNGDPTIPVPATVMDATWLNAVQAELINILTAASISPVKGTNNQVLAALRALFAPKSTFGHVHFLAGPPFVACDSANNAGASILPDFGANDEISVVFSTPFSDAFYTLTLQDESSALPNIIGSGGAYTLVSKTASGFTLKTNPAGHDLTTGVGNYNQFLFTAIGT